MTTKPMQSYTPLEKMISEQLMILGNQFDLEGSDWDFLEASLRTLAKASREEALREALAETDRCDMHCEWNIKQLLNPPTK